MIGEHLIAGIVQLQSTPDVEHNILSAIEGITQAAKLGADWICLPENTPYLGPTQGLLRAAQPPDGEIIQRLQEVAKRLHVWLLIGSFPERGPDPDHAYNTSALISNTGDLKALYRKLHLFDVETPSGDRLNESDTICAGDDVVITQIGPWSVGLSICYDLRFPELYRALSAQGAHALCIPAAFTAETGRDHWWPLLRARAIENLAYVIAPNQYGHHYANRRSYGRSAIFDPWGNLLASCPDRVSVATTPIDLPSLLKLRAHFPTLSHRRI
jgi:deaminated glutathione amidase